MQEEIVTTEEYSRQSHTDVQFINQLGESGLIQISFAGANALYPTSPIAIT